MTNLINAVQVGLTLTFILFCFKLLLVWRNSFRQAVRSTHPWNANQWLIVGIVVGFSGNIADNAYWGVTWLAVFYGWPAEAWLMEHGPLSNIFSRQIPGVYAVYCHVRAATMLNEHPEDLNAMSVQYFLFGLGMTLLMLLT